MWACTGSINQSNDPRDLGGHDASEREPTAEGTQHIELRAHRGVRGKRKNREPRGGRDVDRAVGAAGDRRIRPTKPLTVPPSHNPKRRSSSRWA